MPSHGSTDRSRQVAAIRRDAGLTQTELAELSGVAQSNIAAYETGRRVPSDKMLRRLTEAAKPRPSERLARFRDEILEAARRHQALEVKVFGSVARRDDRPGSDLDLLVRFAPEASLYDVVELHDEVADLLGLDVDIVSEAGLRGRGRDILAEARPL